jgi:uncharacterized cupredoxin-like copper-binding protein
MLRLRLAVLLVTIAASACTAGSSASTPAWTYGPTIAPASSISALPSPASSATGDTIALSEWKVAVASTVKSGTSTFVISNGGTIPHELLVFKSDLAPSAYPTDPAGDIAEDGAGVTLLSDGDNIDPGGSQTRAVDLAPGTYLFVCNIPGHFTAGMFTVVTVTP